MKKKRSGSGDRSGDRFLHNIVSANLCGLKNMKADACLDRGVMEHGSQHRKHFPHRNIGEAVGYMCFQDVVNGRAINPTANLKLAAGHFLVDSMPTKLKEKMKLVQTIKEIFV